MTALQSGDSYALKRGSDASTRLTAQHTLWKATLGYLLHPSIQIPPQARIADVATGNGYWLLDLARSGIHADRFDGFDISLDQVPIVEPKSDDKVRFHTWDVFHDPPQEFVEAFDVVHIRLFTVMFRGDNYLKVIESLRKLLKPGGYLQWEEVDNVSCNVLKPENIEAPALEEVLAQLSSTGEGQWKESADNILQQNGFSSAHAYHVQYERFEARYWSDCYVSTWAELPSRIVGPVEEMKALWAEAMKEERAGAVINCPMWIWIAQKA